MTERRRPIQYEWAVQRGVGRFVRQAVACEHEFACHDRGPKRSAREHIGEAARFIRRAWMDSELAYVGGHTFRCELKRPGWKPPATEDPHWRDQKRLIRRLAGLGHPTAWANSVAMYAAEALAAGVPLLGDWPTLAQLEDARVAADIRKQEERRDNPRKSYGPGLRRGAVAPGGTLDEMVAFGFDGGGT
jgi:hypothetical protein